MNVCNPPATACTVSYKRTTISVMFGHLKRFNSHGLVINTDAVHPADVGRDTGEDGGLLVGVAARGGHKAGHAMDNPLAVDAAVQGAAGVTLEIQRKRITERTQSQEFRTF